MLCLTISSPGGTSSLKAMLNIALQVSGTRARSRMRDWRDKQSLSRCGHNFLSDVIIKDNETISFTWETCPQILPPSTRVIARFYCIDFYYFLSRIEYRVALKIFNIFR